MQVARGTTRIVFLIHRWAIKIPNYEEWRLFLHGLLSNMQEARFSRTGWPELCPVLWAIPGGWLLVMKRATPLTKVEFDVFMHTEGLDKGAYLIPAEAKPDSFGWFNGKIVAVDYGDQT